MAQEHLPKKHYLETGPGKLVEISAEDAERRGWDEVWNGNWVVGRDSGLRLEGRVEETHPAEGGVKSSASQSTSATLPVLEAPYETSYEIKGVYEQYGNGDVMRESGITMPLGSEDRMKPLHMPGSFSGGNTFAGPAY